MQWNNQSVIVFLDGKRSRVRHRNSPLCGRCIFDEIHFCPLFSSSMNLVSFNFSHILSPSLSVHVSLSLSLFRSTSPSLCVCLSLCLYLSPPLSLSLVLSLPLTHILPICPLCLSLSLTQMLSISPPFS